MLKNTLFSSYSLLLQHLYSPFAIVPVSLRPASRTKTTATIGQFWQAWADDTTCFFFLKLCWCSCSHDCVESVDCIIVTSESYRSRDGSFKGAVSKIVFDTFTVYLVSGLPQNSACLEHPQQMLVSDETEICVVQFGEKKILYKWNKNC